MNIPSCPANGKEHGSVNGRERRRLPGSTQAAPSRHLCPYWRQAEGVQAQMHREKTDRREVDVKMDRDGSDLSASQGVPAATRS